MISVAAYIVYGEDSKVYNLPASGAEATLVYGSDTTDRIEVVMPAGAVDIVELDNALDAYGKLKLDILQNGMFWFNIAALTVSGLAPSQRAGSELTVFADGFYAQSETPQVEDTIILDGIIERTRNSNFGQWSFVLPGPVYGLRPGAMLSYDYQEIKVGSVAYSFTPQGNPVNISEYTATA